MAMNPDPGILLALAIILCVDAAPSASLENNVANRGQIDNTEAKLVDAPGATVRQKRQYFSGYNFGSYGLLGSYDFPDNGFGYLSNRRLESSGNDELYAKIIEGINEIKETLKRPTPPPQIYYQPIYYPIIYTPQHRCQWRSKVNTTRPIMTTTTTTTTALPDMNTRFGGETAEEDIRQISFKPIKPSRPLDRPPPPVEHGTVQEGSQGTGGSTSGKEEGAAAFQPPAPAVSKPTLCDATVLRCCFRDVTVNTCFDKNNCSHLIVDGQNPCSIENIREVVDKYTSNLS